MKEIFQRFYEKYHFDLFNFLFYMVKNREQAEDLVQEVYIKVLRSYDQFQGKSSEKTWLFSIARHVAIDWFRKQKRSHEKDTNSIDDENVHYVIRDTAPLPEEIAIENEEIQLLYKCLSKCTEDQQSVLLLRYIQSFSIKETAEILGWTESKVKTTQHRGIKALKALMEEALRKEEIKDAQKL